MPPIALFGIQFTLALVAYALIAWWYVSPRLAGLRPEGSAAFEPRGACPGRRPGQDGGRDRETADDANLYAVCSANALINVATYDWSRICDRCDELYRAAS